MAPDETQALREMVLHAQVLGDQARLSLRRLERQLAQVEQMLALLLTRLPEDAPPTPDAPLDGEVADP